MNKSFKSVYGQMELMLFLMLVLISSYCLDELFLLQTGTVACLSVYLSRCRSEAEARCGCGCGCRSTRGRRGRAVHLAAPGDRGEDIGPAGRVEGRMGMIMDVPETWGVAKTPGPQDT